MHNITDNSWATVLNVDSTQQLSCLALVGGTDNQFSTSDSYEIYEYIECTISEGNAVALDSSGNSISPVLPTFGVFLSRELDVSAGVANGDITDQFVEVDGVGENITVQGALRAILAASAGLLSGATSTDVRFRNQQDTVDVIEAGVNGTGDRLTITLNLNY